MNDSGHRSRQCPRWIRVVQGNLPSESGAAGQFVAKEETGKSRVSVSHCCKCRRLRQVNFGSEVQQVGLPQRTGQNSTGTAWEAAAESESSRESATL